MNRIKEKRGCVSQTAFCRGLSIPRYLLSLIENGRCNPTPPQLFELCEALDTRAGELFSPESLDYRALIKKPAGQKRRGKNFGVLIKKRLSAEIKRQMRRLGLKTQADYLGFAAGLVRKHIEAGGAAGETA